MTIVYFDCFAGASGDMLLAALLDAGASLEAVQAELDKLPVDGYSIKTKRVKKKGLEALDLTVEVREKELPHRHFRDIRHMLAESSLTPAVRERSLAVFTRLALAEGKVHGHSPETVHFHEVGAVDAIVDIVGIAAALEALGATEVHASPLHVGSGFVQCAHGLLPVPAPATMALLQGLPVYSRGLEAGLLTPTGAAVLATLATFGPLPAMTVLNTGYGAGKRDLPIPNLLRVITGSREQAGAALETIVQLEANIDDLNPEIYGYVLDRLFAAGALDAYLVPLQMKKSRPGTLLCALTLPEKEAAVLDVLFRETSTLGVRRTIAEKLTLPRRHVTVSTPFGPARVKVAAWQNEEINAAPEYQDCLLLASKSGASLKEVYAAVIAAYHLQKMLPQEPTGA